MIVTGSTLKSARENARLSQSEMAELSGVDPARISRLERGNSDRMLKGYARILEAYGFQIMPKPYRLEKIDWLGESLSEWERIDRAVRHYINGYLRGDE